MTAPFDPNTQSGRLAMLAAMQVASREFYYAATRIGCHAFIEFTGLMNEFIVLCRASEERGIGWVGANVHSDEHLPFAPHHLQYLSEKLECIYGIRLRSSAAPAAETEQP